VEHQGGKERKEGCQRAIVVLLVRARSWRSSSKTRTRLPNTLVRDELLYGGAGAVAVLIGARIEHGRPAKRKLRSRRLCPRRQGCMNRTTKERELLPRNVARLWPTRTTTQRPLLVPVNNDIREKKPPWSKTVIVGITIEQSVLRTTFKSFEKMNHQCDNVKC